MSHVDEGVLHAFLDGELPAAERAELERHLADCAACQARLDEERALARRAGELLGLAQPPAVVRRKRAWWRVRTPVAWAASIILALALGYSLQDVGSDAATPVATETRGPAQQVALSADSTLGYVSEPKTLQRQRREQATAAAAPAAPGAPTAGAGARTRSDSVFLDQLGGRPSANVIAVAPPAPAPLTTRTPAAAPAERAERDDSVRQPRVIVDGAPLAGSVARRSVADLRGRAGATEWPIIRRGSARDLLGTDPVGIPGLEIREIRRSPAQDGTVLVEQRLDSTTIIQLYQRSTRAEEQRAFGFSIRDQGTSDRLARYVGGLRVEIAGPLSQDSLNRLLEQLKPLP
jgi:anti-sigma factor RsiW